MSSFVLSVISVIKLIHPFFSVNLLLWFRSDLAHYFTTIVTCPTSVKRDIKRKLQAKQLLKREESQLVSFFFLNEIVKQYLESVGSELNNSLNTSFGASQLSIADTEQGTVHFQLIVVFSRLQFRQFY